MLWGKTKNGQPYVKSSGKPITGLDEIHGDGKQTILNTVGMSVDQGIHALLNSKGTVKNSYGLWIDGKLIVPNSDHPLPEKIKKEIELREDKSIPEMIKRLRGWSDKDSGTVIKHSQLFKK